VADTTEPKRVFIAATKQDQGKTTVSLGLMAALEKLYPPVAFIKPVGQRYVQIEGKRIDKDAALMQRVFGLRCDLADTSPIAVARTFTRDYIADPQPNVLIDRITSSFAHVADGAGAVVIEGTGHAGVGSCFDASNAVVAKLLAAKVILVTSGGIGKPIDEVMLNKGLLDQRGVELLGVVLNKVLPEKIESITDFVRKGLGRLGVPLLGSIPFEPSLQNPTVRQVIREIGGELLLGEGGIDRPIQRVLVGAMTARNALQYISPGCLLITPGDRDDMIMTVASVCDDATDPSEYPAGMLLTGGLRPDAGVMRCIEDTPIPVVLIDQDSYSVATHVDNLRVKIQPEDTAKIEIACRLVQDHLDIEQLMRLL